MPYKTHAAFRCKNCGHIEGPEHAGENDLPHACSVCDAGVIHDPKFTALANELGQAECSAERRIQIAKQMKALGDDPKNLDPSNWEVLSDCTHERLHELGIEHDCVCKHEPKVRTKPRVGQVISLTASDAPAAG